MARKRPKGRPSLGGAGRHVQQYRVSGECVDKKLAVINHLEQCKKVRKTIQHYYPNLDSRSYNSKRTTILRWVRERKQLEAAAAQGKGDHKKLRSVGTGTIMSAESEAYLAQWVNELRDEGIPVSTKMLTDKALDVAEEAELPDFRASDKWVGGFKNRHRFSFRCPTRQGQISPADINVIAADFAAKVEATVRDLGITRVYNADQTAVFFEYVAKKTLNKRGQKTVWVKSSGASKERASVMLLGDSDGNRYMPYVVFKTKPSTDKAIRDYNDRHMCGFGYRIWQDVREIRRTTGLEVFGNSKGWWNEKLSVAFLQFHFGSRVSQDPVLLLWDDVSGHWTEMVKSYAASINVVLLKVPPHATPVSQPADVAWNFPLKARLRQYWHDDMKEQIRQGRNSSTKLKLKRPNRATICNWVLQAWGELSTETISNGFRASGLLPSDNCVASAELVADLEKLHLLEGDSVEMSHDFLLGDVVEEAVV